MGYEGNIGIVNSKPHMGCIRIWCRICFYQNDDEEMNMNESLIIFTTEKLLEWLEDDSCPKGIGTREEVASQLRVRLSELQTYWDINHADRRCPVCHGEGETVEFLGMMDDLPMMKTEECENCLGKGTMKV